MKRVFFWSSRFLPQKGGIQILGNALVHALSDRGYEIVVVTQQHDSSEPDEEDIDGLLVRRFPFWETFERREGPQLHAMRTRIEALKREFQPRLTHHFHIGPEAFFDLHTGMGRNVPMVCTLHSMYPVETFAPGTLVRRLLLGSTWVTTASQAILGLVRGELPALEPRSSAICNAIPCTPLEPTDPAFSPPRVLCLGRLVEEKGFDLALAAFPAILRRHPAARLVIAGDGPLRESLEYLAGRLRIDAAVDFLGWQEPGSVPALIASTSVVVMPSHSEGFPLAALQAAQSARPIVATRTGGLAEIVRDRETGILIEDGDVPALARAVISLLGDPHQATTLGREARKHAGEAFPWDRYVDAFDALFARLIAAGISKSIAG